MDVIVQAQNLAGTCGVGIINQFARKQTYNTGYRVNSLPPGYPGGAGWMIAGFINTAECAVIYKQMCAEFRLIFQSPTRRNENSYNGFFFCIFDRRNSKKAKTESPTIEPRWPNNWVKAPE